jgi:hypothetical protein
MRANGKYDVSLVEIFMTNGNGVASFAQSIYENLLSKLDSHQANVAVLSFNDTGISSKLQFNLCQRKFKEMLNIVRPSITTPAIKDLLTHIDNFKGKLDNLKNDKTIRTTIDSLKVLLR